MKNLTLTPEQTVALRDAVGSAISSIYKAVLAYEAKAVDLEVSEAARNINRNVATGLRERIATLRSIQDAV